MNTCRNRIRSPLHTAIPAGLLAGCTGERLPRAVAIATAPQSAIATPDDFNDLKFNDPIFNGLLGVDSLWSIGDRATGPAARGQARAPARQP